MSDTENQQDTTDYSSYFEFMKDSDKHIAIVCHDQPDPDCLASAMAVESIAKHFGLSATIYYGGELAHTQNRVMVNVLNIVTQRLDEEDEDVLESMKEAISNSLIVLVDTANFGKENCSRISGVVEKGRDPDLIIDHHELNPSFNGSYLHESFGSCSTILYRAMKALDITVGKTLATALYLGINTDTADLKAEPTTDEDSESYEELKSQVDLEKFLKILNYPKPLALIDLRRRAYATLEICNNLAVASVGIITPQQRSLLAELCVELLEVESIETSVIMAIVDEGSKSDKFLVASFRSSVLAINTRDFMTKVFGKKNAGGRKGAGAASVKLDGIHVVALDNIRKTHGDNGHLSEYTGFIFDAYSSRIKEEKDNI